MDHLYKFNEDMDKSPIMNKELLIKALKTLFFSWGSDAPAEVIWGGNEILDWIEIEFNVIFTARFDEGSDNYNFDEVIEEIRNF